jgi:hypothetical protein
MAFFYQFQSHQISLENKVNLEINYCTNFFQIRDHMTNEFSVQAVIDSEIADLRRLVSGQKSSKKKKKSAAAMKMNMSKKPSYFNHRFGFNYNFHSHSHSHMTMSYNNKPQQRQQYQPTMTATSSRTAVYNNSYTSEFVKYSWQKSLLISKYHFFIDFIIL